VIKTIEEDEPYPGCHSAGPSVIAHRVSALLRLRRQLPGNNKLQTNQQ